MRVQDSQAYKKMDVTREGISCNLELRKLALIQFMDTSLIEIISLSYKDENLSIHRPWL